MCICCSKQFRIIGIVAGFQPDPIVPLIGCGQRSPPLRPSCRPYQGTDAPPYKELTLPQSLNRDRSILHLSTTCKLNKNRV